MRMIRAAATDTTYVPLLPPALYLTAVLRFTSAGSRPRSSAAACDKGTLHGLRACSAATDHRESYERCRQNASGFTFFAIDTYTSPSRRFITEE